jgi:hypothetical protein
MDHIFKISMLSYSIKAFESPFPCAAPTINVDFPVGINLSGMPSYIMTWLGMAHEL